MAENRKYLSAYSVLKIKQGILKGLYAYNYDELNIIYQETKKDCSTVLFNYANGVTKGYKIEDIFEIFDFLFCLGKPVKIEATVPDSDFPSYLLYMEKKYAHFTICKGLSRDKFYEKAAKCHIGVYLGMDGELSDSSMEQTLLGQVIVYRSAKHNRDWYYPDYPFVGNNLQEVKVHIKDVAENYWSDRIQGILQKQREYVRTKFNGGSAALAVYTVLETDRQERIKNWKGIPALRKVLQDLIKDKQEIAYADLKELVYSGTETKLCMDKAHGRIRITKMVVHWVMLQSGFVDTCQSEDPYYIRV